MNTHNHSSRSLRWPVAPALAFLLFGVLAQACATSSSSTAAQPAGPVELDQTKWKLLMLGGSLDGRVVQFHKRGADGYEGKLVEKGRKLQDVVGLQEGETIFKLKRRSDTEFEGTYKAIDAKGGVAEKEVTIDVKNNNLLWNQESATWEKQD